MNVLILWNCTLNMVKMVNFLSCTIHKNKFKNQLLEKSSVIPITTIFSLQTKYFKICYQFIPLNSSNTAVCVILIFAYIVPSTQNVFPFCLISTYSWCNPWSFFCFLRISQPEPVTSYSYSNNSVFIHTHIHNTVFRLSW